MPQPPDAPNTASRSDFGPVVRQVSSRLTRLIVSPRRQRLVAGVREGLRRARRLPHRIDYFHEVDDPYSHLAAQALAPLVERYEIEIVPHLTTRSETPNVPEPELLARLAHRDARTVAPHYGLTFPEPLLPPSPEGVRLAQRVLAGALREGDALAFGDRAVALGDALYGGDKRAVESLAARHAPASEADTDAAVAAGAKRRERLGHYSGAMFHYAGVWYWGVDRLYHLERRLEALGAARVAGGPRFSRPRIVSDPVPRAAEMTLEVFPSLRSPYTAIGFEPTLDLARSTRVALRTRPVLPMVMRGVPVTLAKGMYIMTDTRREADALGMPFGKILDPIGEPVRRGYSLWPFARSRGRGDAYLAAFLRAAFAEGVDTSRDTGLQRVVESAGLSWRDALPHLGDPAWEEELEANRLAMVGELGQWGVPSYRLRGPAGEPDLCAWGQDRLWLVAAEIQRRGHSDGGEEA